MHSAADRIGQHVAGWLKERLTGGIGVAVATTDRLYPLLPEEESFVSGAVESRRMEFSAGRHCARKALEEIGIASQAIGRGARMQPIWPQGCCGSITHAMGICAAVAGRVREVAGLGIDIVGLREAEVLLRPSAYVFAGEAEAARARLALGAAGQETHSLAILFSAKESAIKAMSAQFDRYVEFTEVEVRFEGSGFVAECSGFGAQAQGWWAVNDECGSTAAVMRARVD